MEFAFNNSQQATILMALFEVPKGRKCQSPSYVDGINKKDILSYVKSENPFRD